MKPLTPHFVEMNIRDLLNTFDPDPGREGLADTPARVRKYFEQATCGYGQDPKLILKCFKDGAERVDEMVFQGSISFYSLCEHHLAPFFGMVHIGYIPKDRILGLSKFSRLIEVFARRLQVQERMTNQIAEALWTGLEPLGVGVSMRARHLCMESRGVQKVGSSTITQAMRGAMMTEPSARSEFMKLVELAESRSFHL